jgi:hypothetical protein
MSRRLIGIAVVATFLLALAPLAIAADDPFVGTWKLNVAKSRFAPGQELESEICKIEAQGNGLKIVYDPVPVHGKSLHVETTVKYDGKDYSAIGDSSFDTYSLTKIAANTVDGVWRKKGKVVQTARWVVSKNGKTFTGTLKSKNTKGEEVTQIAVFEKQ